MGTYRDWGMLLMVYGFGTFALFLVGSIMLGVGPIDRPLSLPLRAVFEVGPALGAAAIRLVSLRDIGVRPAPEGGLILLMSVVALTGTAVIGLVGLGLRMYGDLQAPEQQQARQHAEEQYGEEPGNDLERF